MKEFKVKTAEELEKLNAEELQAYFVAKLNHENEVLEGRLKSLEDEKEDTDKYDELTKEIKELKGVQLDTLQKALKEQGKVIEGLKNGTIGGAEMKAAEGSVAKALQDFADDFHKSRTERHEFGFDLDLKVAGDMTLAGNVTGTMPQAERLPGVNDIAERAVITYNLIPKLNTAANTIEWVYETGQDGTIDGTAEGAAKDQIDNDFVVASVALVKRAAYFKVSTEMLDDVTFMEGWLRNKLIVRLFLDIDNQVLNGDDIAPNLNGVITQATTFAAGTFANTVDNANDIDSLVVAVNQIEIANQGVNNLTIMMHPSDIASLKLVKLSTTDKRYIDRLIDAAGMLSLDGVPIVKNVNITVGDFLVGDYSKATIVQKSSIRIEIGLDGNDFTKNMRTLLAEWRGQCFIQTNDTTAFVTGTFATTNAALETP